MFSKVHAELMWLLVVFVHRVSMSRLKFHLTSNFRFNSCFNIDFAQNLILFFVQSRELDRYYREFDAPFSSITHLITVNYDIESPSKTI